MRSTKFSIPFKDFDPLFVSNGTNNIINNNNPSDTSSTASSKYDQISISSSLNASNLITATIDDYFWLRNEMTIKEWLRIIGFYEENSNATDFWKFEIRFKIILKNFQNILIIFFKTKT